MVVRACAANHATASNLRLDFGLEAGIENFDKVGILGSGSRGTWPGSHVPSQVPWSVPGLDALFSAASYLYSLILGEYGTLFMDT